MGTKRSIATEAKHWNVNADRIVGQAVTIAEQVQEHLTDIDEHHPGVRAVVERRANAFLKG